jgi:radical SAM superfamily enzyme YgiQ (UPF0313 family)
MRYEGTVYRPPSEADSLLIQATIGCPHNRCTFCAMYKNTRFRIRKVDDIKEDLRAARDYYGDMVESVFFPDGNTIIMRTDQLADIFNYTRELFPHLQRITVYGAARFVNLKSEDELKQLHAAGLNRVHMGMESGDDVVLERLKKGVTSLEIIEAGKKLKAAGIQTSEYYLVGAGGRDRSQEHAINSAKVLSAFSPAFIRLRTLVPQPGTPLYQEYQDGTFCLPGPHEALREIRLLIEHLECENSMVLSDHISNYCDVNGMIPRDRQSMIEALDRCLSIDESRFRGPYLEHL